MVLVQLPLTVIIGCVALAVPAAWPGLLGEGLFQVSLLVHSLLFVACWVVPWKRLPSVATLSIPAGNVVALALSRLGAAEFLPGLSVLLIFPVIWLAASGRFPRLIMLISFVVPLVLGLVPLLLGSLKVTATQITTTVLVALMLLAVALTVRFVTATLFLQQRKLERKDAELLQLLESSEKSEKLLKAVLDTIDVGVMVVDATGQIVLRNRQQKVFEESVPGSDVNGRSLVLYGQDRRTLLPMDRMPATRAIRGETFADYYVWAGEGKGALALSTAARSMNAESGEFAGAVVAYSDVTSLVEAVTAKDDIIAMVSHELRAPLTSILGNLELAQEAHELQEVSHHVNIAHRSAERLTEMVSDLLLSTSAAMTTHPRTMDIAGLIDSVIVSASLQAAEAGVKISTDVPSPLWTYADPLRMSQVLDNLLSNAIKYTAEGGAIAVEARTEDGQLTLSVRDTGVGMSPLDAERVFEKFFRTRSARASSVPGTGLGLSITRAIIEGHQGEIFCTSEPGHGSTFTVRLPSPV
ncbi:cell wall metabolism sensor histidine kinase WalK [Arthrobacter sp. B1805]|uniref:sensor histidine kinase n=1 Tax=Arthrobacter sp. B1805 TaxID=2058892 RepID=UPI0015E2C225|nr:HAMP domain-containing sensor histidine kinase [Arthrobacter sp. B1805]